MNPFVKAVIVISAVCASQFGANAQFNQPVSLVPGEAVTII